MRVLVMATVTTIFLTLLIASCGADRAHKARTGSKVPKVSLGHIYSQGRPIGGTVSVDRQETYDTMIRLGRGDWVNLSCYYDSFRHVEEGDVAYATVSLSSCIDLK